MSTVMRSGMWVASASSDSVVESSDAMVPAAVAESLTAAKAQMTLEKVVVSEKGKWAE